MRLQGIHTQEDNSAGYKHFFFSIEKGGEFTTDYEKL